jgi:hypothetical protein
VRTRTTTITDWRVRDEDLPDVPPGGEHDRAITPQKHVVLCRIVVRDLRLVRLQVGEVEVPFELDSEDGALRTYRPACQRRGVPLSTLIAALVRAGAHPTSSDEIGIPAALDVRVTLRNDTDAPARPRAALLVREEIS